MDATSHGTDFLLQATYTPNKQVEIYSRFRNESKQSNRSTDQANQPGTHIMNDLVFLPRQDWRTQVSYMINRSITLRNRVELLWYDHRGPNKENGFLIFSDLIYKPLLKPYSGTVRLEYFETGGYNSRVYAYENDVLYSYSIPASYNKGFRYYFNLNYDLNKKLSVWLRLAQTVNRDKMPIGSGLDEVPGGRKTELKLQLGWTL